MLAVNAWDESKKRVTRYVQKEKLKQQFLQDGSDVWKSQYGKLLPQVVWIDRDGMIMERSLGFDPKTSPGVLEEDTKRLMVSTN